MIITDMLSGNKLIQKLNNIVSVCKCATARISYYKLCLTSTKVTGCEASNLRSIYYLVLTYIHLHRPTLHSLKITWNGGN